MFGLVVNGGKGNIGMCVRALNLAAEQFSKLSQETQARLEGVVSLFKATFDVSAACNAELSSKFREFESGISDVIAAQAMLSGEAMQRRVQKIRETSLTKGNIHTLLQLAAH